MRFGKKKPFWGKKAFLGKKRFGEKPFGEKAFRKKSVGGGGWGEAFAMFNEKCLESVLD